MKKYVLGILVAFALLSAPARAAEPIFGFLDGKFYDSTATLRYQCFMDGNCYDLDGKPAPFKIVPVSFTQPTPPVDSCANIEGVQSVVPLGMISQNGNCVSSAAATLSNIDTTKADRVVSQINTYIAGLNVQIEAINNTKFDTGNLNHDYTTINAIKLNPGITNWREVPGYRDLQAKLLPLNESIRRLTTILSEIQSYVLAAKPLPVEESEYLQSIGINW
jgi:hypothetical protein